MPFSIVLSPQERAVLEKVRIERGLRSHAAAVKVLIREAQTTKATQGKARREKEKD